MSLEIYFPNRPNPCLIDHEKFPVYQQYKWYMMDTGYVKTTVKINNQHIFLHQHILGVLTIKQGNQQIDHINGKPFDNRLSNLRLCTISQNHQRQQKTVYKTTSKYKGVFYNKFRRYWSAAIYNPNRLHLGCFKTELEAAIAYNNAAIKYFGEFARLNDLP